MTAEDRLKNLTDNLKAHFGAAWPVLRSLVVRYGDARAAEALSAASVHNPQDSETQGCPAKSA